MQEDKKGKTGPKKDSKLNMNLYIVISLIILIPCVLFMIIIRDRESVIRAAFVLFVLLVPIAYQLFLRKLRDTNKKK